MEREGGKKVGRCRRETEKKANNKGESGTCLSLLLLLMLLAVADDVLAVTDAEI